MSLGRKSIKAQRSKSSIRQTDVETAQLLAQQNASNIVNWDHDLDPANPLNWSPRKKWANILTISLASFSISLASTIYAPGLLYAFAEFHNTNTILQTLSVTIFVLGNSAGPLVAAPFSEFLGRRPVYIASSIVLLAFTCACGASTSVNMLIAMRFLAGVGGSTPVMLGGATVADLYPPEHRGIAMSVWGSGTLLGPIVGPIAGGFIVQDLGWRWTFWIQACIGALTCILTIIFVQESYPVVLLERKTIRVRKETGDASKVSALYHGVGHGRQLWNAMKRPLSILCFSPVTALFSVYHAVLFGFLYLLIASFPAVFTDVYGFSSSAVGLTYLGLGVGTPFGLFIAGKLSDSIYARLTAKHGGVQKPEYRIPPVFVSSPLIAISLFWYGWTVEERVHWMAPITATALFTAGVIPVTLSINMYLVDTFPSYAASALAAAKLVQSLGGAFLPLLAAPLYEALGYGWGNTVLGLIAVAFVPVPLYFFWRGERLRGVGRYGGVKL